jgi:hypothetical protein
VCCSREEGFVQQVIDVLTARSEELRVFFTQHAVAEDAACHKSPFDD